MEWLSSRFGKEIDASFYQDGSEGAVYSHVRTSMYSAATSSKQPCGPQRPSARKMRRRNFAAK